VSRSSTSLSSWPLVVAFAAAYIPNYMFPHVVTAFLEIDHSTASDAGLLAMIESAALALANIAVVLVPTRWRMKLTVVASIVAALAELASTFPTPFAQLMVLRALVGAGFGVAGFMAAQLIAVSGSPSRTFGLANGMLALSAGILLAIVPLLLGNSAQRVFVPLGLLAMCLGPFLWSAGRSQHVDGTVDAAPTRRLTLPVSGLFLAAALLFVPLGGLYVFAGYQGAHLSMSEAAVGAALGWTTITGLAGGTAAAWLCTKRGLLYPMVITCLLAAATCFAIGGASNATQFVLAYVLFGITYMFAMTTMSAICSAADRSGQIAAVLVGWQVLAVAVGSALVGFLVDGSHAALTWEVGVLACLLALLPAGLGAIKVIDSGRTAASNDRPSLA
jgi:hypothetical protein